MKTVGWTCLDSGSETRKHKKKKPTKQPKPHNDAADDVNAHEPLRISPQKNPDGTLAPRLDLDDTRAASLNDPRTPSNLLA